MKYNNQKQDMILVNDIYHWELDPSGYFLVKENSSKVKSNKRSKTEFRTINTAGIMEDLRDE